LKRLVRARAVVSCSVSYCSPHRNSADVVSAVSPHLTSPTERTQSTAAVNVRPPDLHVDYVSLSRLPCTSPILLLLLSSSPERTQSTLSPPSERTQSTLSPPSDRTQTTLSPPSERTQSTLSPASERTQTTLFPLSEMTQSTLSPSSERTQTTLFPLSARTQSTLSPPSERTQSTAAVGVRPVTADLDVVDTDITRRRACDSTRLIIGRLLDSDALPKVSSITTSRARAHTHTHTPV